MALPSVLVIGASGFLGQYVCRELHRQRSKFARVAILTEESKRPKFEALESQGMEIILGSYLASSSFKGAGPQRFSIFPKALPRSDDRQVSILSMRLWGTTS